MGLEPGSLVTATLPGRQSDPMDLWSPQVEQLRENIAIVALAMEMAGVLDAMSRGGT